MSQLYELFLAKSESNIPKKVCLTPTKTYQIFMKNSGGNYITPTELTCRIILMRADVNLDQLGRAWEEVLVFREQVC